MVKELYIGFLLLKASLSSQLAYRQSFIIEVVGRILLTLVDITILLTLFRHIQALGGWTKWEVVYLYGVASLSLSIARALTYGLQDMEELVRLGTLDGILVRPASALVQIACRRSNPFLATRLIEGIVVLSFVLYQLHWTPSILTLCMIVVNVGSTAIVFTSVFMAEAATQIYIVESREAFNAFTYGGAQMVQYPISVYPGWLRSVFLFGVPVGYTAYFPALVVLDKPDFLNFGIYAPYLAPGVSGLFLTLTVFWWQHAIEHYRSTGS